MTRLFELVETSSRVAASRSRKDKIAALAGLLGALDREEVPITTAYLAGELPQGRIGLGWAAVRDLVVAAPPEFSRLQLVEVDRAFTEIGATSGAGSKARKLSLLADLFERSTADERDFLGRLIVGELRQGALEGLLSDAVATAAGVERAVLRRAVMLGGRLQDVSSAALLEGEAGLAAFRLELFRPLAPMLAGTAEDPEDAIARLGRAAFQFKLDGARVQVHKAGDEVRVYTRRLHEVTAAVPEVVEAVRSVPARELVLDGEVLAFDDSGRPRTFQTTMRRFGRKLDVARMREELPVTAIFFDILHADGEDLIDHVEPDRWRRLTEFFTADSVVRREELSDPEEVDAFFGEALAAGHEGLVGKGLDTTYEAGRRGARWLKLKPAHTLDLVVLAAEWGSGRREGKLSNLHLGARGPDGGLVMLGKTFKGMTDAVLAWQTTELLARETRREGHVVHVRPELVVEVALDGVQESPQYPGGVALRFARLRGYRTDKTAAEADTLEAVRALGGGGLGGS